MEKLGPADPHRIGAYRLLARLGAGGMGHVYLARSDRGRTVAVKLVRQELAEQEQFRARFRQEVRAARRVGGYWTAPVLDADTEAAVPWVATGYVAGPSLQTVVGREHGALPERSVRILAAGLAHALQDIHAAGLIHRDLKPSNVLVTIDGPRVIDFGIARALETVTDGGLTRTGALVGSPGFMAPEQVRGDPITPACDIFCLGSILSYAATGELPFGTANSGVHALMFRIAQEEPDLEGVPEGIADLVRQCLRKDPASRPTLGDILERTGAEDTVTGGRSRDPWLPGMLVAQLGRHAVQLLETEDPEDPEASEASVDPKVPDGSGVPEEKGEGEGEGESAAGWPGVAGPHPYSALPFGASPRTAFEGEAFQAQAPADIESLGGRGGQGSQGGLGAQPSEGRDAAPPTPEAPPAPETARIPLPLPIPEASPEHAPTPDASAPPPLTAFPDGAAFDRFPTMSTGGPQAPPPAAPPAAAGYGPGQAPAPGPLHPAYGYPQQHPPPAGYGYPHQQSGAGDWSASPYGPGTPPPPPPPPQPQPEPPRRGGRSTAVLIVVALVVALGAGASVYALMKGDGNDRAGGEPTKGSTGASVAPGPSGQDDASPRPSTTAEDTPANGAIPAKYVGTWSASIDNDTGRNTRQLTIQQGEVGDTVLSLTADGPADTGTYHCVFRAALAEAPSAGGPLRIGPSEVSVGEPATSCSPGGATELTLLPDGRLRRVNTGSGDALTYTKK
ncbi:serine/threonine-protein kinase [Streptomyces aurantiacus]|uniref:serine/threonine-protein kinase n=2 Tax=Streptomyces aurantiacus TaxID=47760 RepID=UPI0033C10EA4